MPQSLKFPVPKTWTPQFLHAVVLTRSALDVYETLDARKSALAAPIMPIPENIVVKPVDVPRIPSPRLEETVSGSISAEWHELKELKEDAPIVIYFHGGGYVAGHVAGHRSQTFPLALRGLSVLSVDYRLAPENPHPAAITDARSVWKWVLSTGHLPKNVVFSGDSAGGGLTYALSLYLRDIGEELPAGLACITPYVDLSLQSPTHNLLDEFQLCILTKQALEHSTKRGYGGAAHHKLKTEPYYSPVFGSVTKAKLPPQLIVTGTVDLFYADCMAMALRRSHGGETVRLEIYENRNHDFQMSDNSPLGPLCQDRIAAFIKQVCSSSAEPITTQLLIVHDTESPTISELGRKDVVSRLSDLVNRWKADSRFGSVAEIDGAPSQYEAIVKGEV
ncbi:alpha/beta-hydrolase [Gonapodya prolifera JEL478]|uniref:Alpha/beta-hydrolase n=1 Tax=Gonapodya prolifera (strain JEL478) TaxID=1344416 RepID=A0A139A1A0_GONPJ|nr:alpha/beta-hydrolase [Gonapodya prolifera JEL478]|eukprot:KXS10398.1 alpha/beta-hydrolase [Gonapodya prolifera JEL478]